MNHHRPVRILQVVGGMNRGGVETWLLHVLRHVDRERFSLDFLVHTTEPCAYDEEIRALGSRTIPCLQPSRPWTYARNFWRVLREYGPYDVVHSHCYLFDGLVLWAAAQGGVRTRIAHIHPLTDVERRTWRRALYRRAAAALIGRYASLILSPSQASLQAFQSLRACDRPAHVLYNGIDLGPFQRQVDRQAVRRSLSLPANKPLVTYVARFVPHKNHEQVLRVGDRLNADDYRFHFALAGSHGGLRERLEGLVRDRPDVSLLVGLEDVSALLLASDLFFFPSLEEGFGIVAVEAAAAGLPVVATDLPTIREACAPSHHPYLFRPDDDDTAAAHIRAILNDEPLRRRLSGDARQWAGNFSAARSADNLARLYRALADGQACDCLPRGPRAGIGTSLPPDGNGTPHVDPGWLAQPPGMPDA